MVTNRIIELLERGTVPWKKPWKVSNTPRNLISGRKYNGINVFLLNAAGYSSPYWLTYKQAKEKNGFVRKGEAGYPVVFWKWMDAKNDEPPDCKDNNDDVKGNTGENIDENIKRAPLLRYYTVFNAMQCDGITYPIEDYSIDFNPIEKCESVLEKMQNCPELKVNSNRAFYRPLDDIVKMPPKNSFINEPEFYSTLFHELSHSTGHESRLGRKSITELVSYGSHSYGREELIAEMGATYLCSHCGIETTILENSAAYIKGWLRLFRNDKRVVVTSAAQAQKAADYILGEDT